MRLWGGAATNEPIKLAVLAMAPLASLAGDCRVLPKILSVSCSLLFLLHTRSHLCLFSQ